MNYFKLLFTFFFLLKFHRVLSAIYLLALAVNSFSAHGISISGSFEDHKAYAKQFSQIVKISQNSKNGSGSLVEVNDRLIILTAEHTVQLTSSPTTTRIRFRNGFEFILSGVSWYKHPTQDIAFLPLDSHDNHLSVLKPLAIEQNNPEFFEEPVQVAIAGYGINGKQSANYFNRLTTTCDFLACNLFVKFNVEVGLLQKVCRNSLLDGSATPGDSGAPLIKDGKVVGVHIAGAKLLNKLHAFYEYFTKPSLVEFFQKNEKQICQEKDLKRREEYFRKFLTKLQRMTRKFLIDKIPEKILKEILEEEEPSESFRSAIQELFDLPHHYSGAMSRAELILPETYSWIQYCLYLRDFQI